MTTVTKPFRAGRAAGPGVRALLRRGTPETSIVQGVRVDAGRPGGPGIGDTELELTTKEFDLLSVLVGDAGKVVTP